MLITDFSVSRIWRNSTVLAELTFLLTERIALADIHLSLHNITTYNNFMVKHEISELKFSNFINDIIEIQKIKHYNSQNFFIAKM